MIINVDSDGVVYDLVSLTQELARREYGADFPKPTSWGFENWHITWDQVFALWGIPGVFEHGQPEPWAIDGIKDLLNNDHTVRIVTNKHGLPDPAQAMQETIEFYSFWDLLDDVDIVFSGSYAKEYEADVIIDDKPTLEWAQDGKINLLYNQPWNRDAYNLSVIRVHGWSAVGTAIAVLT